MATRSRKLRKIWRILQKENSVAESVLSLLLGIVAQVREGAQVGQMWGSDSEWKEIGGYWALF